MSDPQMELQKRVLVRIDKAIFPLVRVCIPKCCLMGCLVL